MRGVDWNTNATMLWDIFAYDVDWNTNNAMGDLCEADDEPQGNFFFKKRNLLISKNHPG